MGVFVFCCACNGCNQGKQMYCDGDFLPEYSYEEWHSNLLVVIKKFIFSISCVLYLAQEWMITTEVTELNSDQMTLLLH